jgi:hypothetical protein
MTYGWKDWLLGEEVAMEHIKYASVLPLKMSVAIRYDAGIQTFGTADASGSVARCCWRPMAGRCTPMDIPGFTW